MADERMTLLEALRKGAEPAAGVGEGGGGEDFLRDAVRWLLGELMDAEVSAQIGAGRYERAEERTTQRNGYRRRPWDTRLGDDRPEWTNIGYAVQHSWSPTSR